MRRPRRRRSFQRLLDANSLEELFQGDAAERALAFQVLAQCASGTPGRYRAGIATACRRAGTSESYFMDRAAVLLATVVEDEPDLYRMFGVQPSATQDEIRARWRLLAKKIHPDAGGDPETFLATQRVYKTLADPQDRIRYHARWLQQLPALQRAAILAQQGPNAGLGLGRELYSPPYSPPSHDRPALRYRLERGLTACRRAGTVTIRAGAHAIAALVAVPRAGCVAVRCAGVAVVRGGGRVVGASAAGLWRGCVAVWCAGVVVVRGGGRVVGASAAGLRRGRTALWRAGVVVVRGGAHALGAAAIGVWVGCRALWQLGAVFVRGGVHAAAVLVAGARVGWYALRVGAASPARVSRPYPSAPTRRWMSAHASVRLRRSMLAGSAGLLLGALPQHVDDVARWSEVSPMLRGQPATVIGATLNPDTGRRDSLPAPPPADGVCGDAWRGSEPSDASTAENSSTAHGLRSPAMGEGGERSSVPALTAPVRIALRSSAPTAGARSSRRAVLPVAFGEVSLAAPPVASGEPAVAVLAVAPGEASLAAPPIASGESSLVVATSSGGRRRDELLSSQPGALGVSGAIPEGRVRDVAPGFVSTVEVLDLLEQFQRFYRRMSSAELVRLFAPSATDNEHAGRAAIAQAFREEFERLQWVDYEVSDVVVQTVGRLAAVTAVYTVDVVTADGRWRRRRGRAQWWLSRQGEAVEILRLERRPASSAGRER